MFKLFRAVLLVGSALLLMLVAWLTVLRAEEPTESSMIAFVSNRDELRWEPYVMLADGSNLRRILRQSGEYRPARAPVWSADGEWIAFTLYEPDGYAQIYRVRPGGSGLQQLTEHPGQHFAHGWSPDSQWIAYSDSSNVFIMRADGGDKIQLTRDGRNRYPVWSPDGEWIVFLRQRPTPQSNFNIHRMRPDGSELRRLTPANFSDFNPAWSADGEWIIFGSDLGTRFRSAYYRMRLDDAELVGLHDNFNRVTRAPVDWSSSGEWAVYAAPVVGNLDIYLARADGMQVVHLTNHESAVLSPTWSPPISLDWRGWINALAGITILFVGMIGIARDEARNLAE